MQTHPKYAYNRGLALNTAFYFDDKIICYKRRQTLVEGNECPPINVEE